MTDPPPLTRAAASAAVDDLGWRYLLGALHTSIKVTDLAQAAQVGTAAVAAAGTQAQQRLWVDLRHDRLLLRLQHPDSGVTAVEVDLAGRVSAAAAHLGTATRADTNARAVQALEIAIDAMRIGEVRPFWAAVLSYVEQDGEDPAGPLIDPLGQGPTVWFQQMDAARPQRNRIHLDVSVGHDQAPARVRAALAAGGRLVSAARAPSFWVLADAEGNEVCVSTWQGRD